MRVLLATQSYPPVLGGLQTAVQALARHFAKNGHAVHVLANRYPRRLPPFELDDGVPVTRILLLKPKVQYLRIARPDLLLASLAFYPAALARMERLIRSFRPDVVNVHFPDAQIPFVLKMRKRFSFRLVVSLHGHEIKRFFEPAWRAGRHEPSDKSPHRRAHAAPLAGLKTLLRESDAVTACSQYLLDQAIAIDRQVAGKGIAIYNGIDPERFRDVDPFAWPRPYILACGRLTHSKGFDLLLEAYAQLEDSCRRADLLIAGSGEERQALRDQAQRLGIQKKVQFLGRVPPSDVVRLLQGCEFVVAPSREESMGIVMLETLAAGRRLLATDVGGMAEFVRRNRLADSRRNTASSGTRSALVRLVEPKVADLSRGLREWLTSDALPDEAAEDNRILRDFTWSAVARRFEQVLRGNRLEETEPEPHLLGDRSG